MKMFEALYRAREWQSGKVKANAFRFLKIVLYFGSKHTGADLLTLESLCRLVILDKAFWLVFQDFCKVILES